MVDKVNFQYVTKFFSDTHMQTDRHTRSGLMSIF